MRELLDLLQEKIGDCFRLFTREGFTCCSINQDSSYRKVD